MPSSLERPATRTAVTARDLRDAVRAAWPELDEESARMLVAQSAHETQRWARACWNWNFGGIKPVEGQTFARLRTWEAMTPAAAAAAHAADPAHAIIMSAEESKAWGAPPGKVGVRFIPPNDVARFAAYDSLAEGCAGWLALHRRVARHFPDYLHALADGDAVKVAHLMSADRYFTGGEAAYARCLATERAWVEEQLGAAAPSVDTSELAQGSGGVVHVLDYPTGAQSDV